MSTTDRPSNAVADRSSHEADQPLFRPEAIEEQQTQWLGTVLLAPRISHKLFALFAGVTATLILCLLFFGDYTRKERIQGWLVPEQGLIRIFAPQTGVVTELHVEEGDLVTKGTALLSLSTDLQSATFGATQEEVLQRLESRREGLLSERGLKQVMHRTETATLRQRLQALDVEERYRDNELLVQKERVDLALASLERLKPLRERGLMAEQRWQQVEDERLDHTLRLRALERDRAAAARERLTLEAEQQSLPLKHRTEVSEIDRNVAALEQQIAEAEAKRQLVILAPQAGTVTAIQTELGGTANAAVPLLNIVPEGSKLQAELFLPSRARGFVKPGQAVLLRYQAFPYQKFGHYEGKVARIAQSAIAPGEFARQIPGAANLQGAGEPVYPVAVSLAAQTATAYGEEIPLQSGMQLEADVQIESRSLIEWVLDPLFTLTGSWQGGDKTS